MDSCSLPGRPFETSMMDHAGRALRAEPDEAGRHSGVARSAASSPPSPSVRALAVPEAPADPNSVTSPHSRETQRAKVLIVDDDHDTARAMCRMLTRVGYAAEVVGSGRDALSALKDGQFDVILSDIGMPEMDGFDLIHAIRNLDERVPIVLLTGEPTVGTAARALEVGAFRYVTKPASPSALTEVVEKASQMHRMARVKEEAREILRMDSHPGTDLLTLGRNFDRCMEHLWVAFQPIVDAKTRQIYGYEALMRSREPSLPHPGAVLDAAETLRRLDEVGQRIRGLTGEAIPRAPGNPSIFVNLHVRDLIDPTLMSPDSPLMPFAHQVVLEVTERASLAEVKDVRQRVLELRSAGFRIAVDDLGAGYAGLTSFALLEPEIVKLDMSLIRDVHISPTKRKVVRSMTNLARDMGMLVVAEGIESPEERDTVVELGCDFLQGFLLARPAPPFPEVSW
jgi:EAL domain-containing protein (putative c-di-GMP-specific phosphodiesterase class I)